MLPLDATVRAILTAHRLHDAEWPFLAINGIQVPRERFWYHVALDGDQILVRADSGIDEDSIVVLAFENGLVLSKKVRRSTNSFYISRRKDSTVRGELPPGHQRMLGIPPGLGGCGYEEGDI